MYLKNLNGLSTHVIDGPVADGFLNYTWYVAARIFNRTVHADIYSQYFG